MKKLLKYLLFILAAAVLWATAADREMSSVMPEDVADMVMEKAISLSPTMSSVCHARPHSQIRNARKVR